MFDRPDMVDTNSEEFNALSAEVKHELLTEIKESYRRRYKQKHQTEVKLPDVSLCQFVFVKVFVSCQYCAIKFFQGAVFRDIFTIKSHLTFKSLSLSFRAILPLAKNLKNIYAHAHVKKYMYHM